MALTGTFLADFNAFVVECMKADDGLNQMRLSAAAAEKQIDKLTTEFNGQKVVTEAAAMMEAVERIGGAAKLTEAELQRVALKAQEAAVKLRAMGEDVPPLMEKWAATAKQAGTATAGATEQAQGSMTSTMGTMGKMAAAAGIAFSVGAVVNFGKSLLDTADNLVRLSDQTGMSIEEAQRLSYVADQTGTSLEQMTTASSRLQSALETVAGQDAVEKLGIDFAKLRAASPHEQILMISDAFREIENPVERSRRAVELFGKAGTTILPTLLADIRQIGADASIASTETVSALEAAGDALSDLATRTKNAAIQIAGGLLIAGQQIKEQGLLKTIEDWNNSPTPAHFIQHLNDMAAAERTFINLQKQAEGIAGLGLEGSAKKTPREIAAEEREAAEAKRAAEKATADLAAAEVELVQVRMGQAGLLATMSAETRALATADLELGASQKSIAVIYGLTTEQVKALDAARTAGIKTTEKAEAAAKKAAEAELAAQRMVSEARATFYQESTAQQASALQQQTLAIGTWQAEQMAALAATGGATEAQYAEIARIADEKLAAIGVDWDALREHSQTTLRETYQTAERTYQEALARSGDMSKGSIAHFKELRDEALAAYEGIATAAKTTLDTQIEYAQQFGVTLQAAADALGTSSELATANTEKMTRSMETAAGAGQQMYAQMQQLESQARSTFEKLQAGTALFEAYQKAGVATGMQIATGGYQFQKQLETLLPTWSSQGSSDVNQQARGNGGATTTTNTLNVNVNNAQAGDIAGRLVTEMRHSGTRFV